MRPGFKPGIFRFPVLSATTPPLVVRFKIAVPTFAPYWHENPPYLNVYHKLSTIASKLCYLDCFDPQKRSSQSVLFPLVHQKSSSIDSSLYFGELYLSIGVSHCVLSSLVCATVEYIVGPLKMESHFLQGGPKL